MIIRFAVLGLSLAVCLAPETVAQNKAAAHNQNQAAAPAVPDQYEYSRLLGRVKSSDKTVDFTRLRMSYMESPEFKKRRDVSEDKEKMFTGFRAKHFDEVQYYATSVLANNFLDMEAQYAMYVAQKEMKHQQQADFYQYVLKGMLHSINASGTGVVQERAYVVISPEEERMMLQFLNLNMVDDHITAFDGHSIDVVRVNNPESGKSSAVYFNVDIPIKYSLMSKAEAVAAETPAAASEAAGAGSPPSVTPDKDSTPPAPAGTTNPPEPPAKPDSN